MGRGQFHYWPHMFGTICLSVRFLIWVCETYVVHHLVSIVQDYIVRHRPVLCTTDLRCAPWCTRGTYVHEKCGSPPTFFILDHMGHKEYAKNGHFLSVFGGAQEHTMDTLLGGGASYMVHTSQINPSILIGWQLNVRCEAFTGMFIVMHLLVHSLWSIYLYGRCEAFTSWSISILMHL